MATNSADTPRLLFIGTPEDKSYVSYLQSITTGAKVSALFREPTTLAEIKTICKAKGITGVLTTSQVVLKKLALESIKEPKISNYAGSYFFVDDDVTPLEYVILDPLRNCVTVNYGQFLAKRYASKLCAPHEWIQNIPFDWAIITEDNYATAVFDCAGCDLLAVDIETSKDLRITSCSFTAGWIEGRDGLRTFTWVIDCETSDMSAERAEWELSIIQAICESEKSKKIFQNGLYDIAYLGRYGIDVCNYLLDTAECMHSWYSELPKDLASQQAFFVREAHYWKDQSASPDKFVQLLYNAKDTWATLWSFVMWLKQAPQWAKDNYVIKFPTVFPNHMAGMRGLRRDPKRLAAAVADFESRIVARQKELELSVAWPNFNPNSPPQVKKLFEGFGIQLESTDEDHLEVAAMQHALVRCIVDMILDIRGWRKLVSTYLVAEKDFSGRILYSLVPWGTDTGRLASKEHPFWTGMNIQNIPRDYSVKQTICADEGFHLFEVDLEQAESRDTGYISGDAVLIDNVENSPDFHCANASMFFGVPFEELYDVKAGKVLNKDLRTLAKPVNHGANYNMGKNVLLTSMGHGMVMKARKLLNLPKTMSLLSVCEYLLGRFHATYKTIKSVYYAGVIQDVKVRSMLKGATGWTRYCFGKPWSSKRDLNAYVAHPPQSLNAMVLDKAFMQVFYKIALPHFDTFKLGAQIHDSIFGQCKVGYEHHAEEVRKLMEIPVTVKAYDGVTRTFTVPAAVKNGKVDKTTGVKTYAKYWNETE